MTGDSGKSQLVLRKEKEAREKLLTGDYEGDLDLNESNYNNATLDEVR